MFLYVKKACLPEEQMDVGTPNEEETETEVEMRVQSGPQAPNPCSPHPCSPHPCKRVCLTRRLLSPPSPQQDDFWPCEGFMSTCPFFSHSFPPNFGSTDEALAV